MEAIDLSSVAAAIDELWKHKTVARLNDYTVKVVNIEGEFVWHEHLETDELFLVLSGELIIDYPDESVVLGPGQLTVVPKGSRHRTRAKRRASLLLIEPEGTINTGQESNSYTHEPEEWMGGASG